MSYAVTWTREAKLELEQICAYLAAEVSEERAEYVREGLVRAVLPLRIAPQAFPLSRRRDRSDGLTRTLPKWNYVLHFTVDDEAGSVAVVSVEHAHRDT